MANVQFQRDDVEAPFPRQIAGFTDKDGNFIEPHDPNGPGAAWVQFGRGDQGQVVNFYYASIRNDERSRAAGRPIYDRKVYVRIHQPGEAKLQETDREVQESDKQRWPRQWTAFCQQRAYVPEGTPIAMLFPVEPQIADMLRGVGIHTVEDCARLTATAIEQLGMGAQEWVNRARFYLETAQKGVNYHEIEKLKVQHKHEVAALNNQILDLVQRINAIQQGMMNNPAAINTEVARTMAMMQGGTPPEPKPPLPEPPAWSAPPQGFLEPEELPKNGKPSRK